MSVAPTLCNVRMGEMVRRLDEAMTPAAVAPSVTPHVYGGELDHCHVFEPVDDGWLLNYRELTYTA